MLNRDFADHFSTQWISAWNARDLTKILSHYADDFEMTSPVISKLMGMSSNKLEGKAAIGAYWQKALDTVPNLHFEFVTTLLGDESLVVYYKSFRGIAAEVFFFNIQGKVVKAFAHYA